MEPPAVATELAIRVIPRARRDEIAGERGGAVLVRVSAPPVDGKANDAVRRLLAKALGVAPSAIEVVRGQTGRDKVVRVTGLGEPDVRARLS